MQSSRVSITISRMVATPRPSSPTRNAQASSNSTSLDAFDQSPSLSFRRWIRSALRVPSGRQRGSRKQVMPRSACASTRKASHMGAEKNHLWPTSSQVSPLRWARVVLVRTSEPPCFSVMPMPKVTPAFCSAGTKRGSYRSAVRRGRHTCASACSCWSAGTAA